MPFANVAELLASIPLPVPAILDHSDADGIVALQDLGDVTLQAHLGAAGEAEHAALYREAVALIATLQRRGRELASPRYLPYQVAFDVEKLTWELNFFVRHFLEGYKGAALSDGERSALAEEWAPLTQELAGEPGVLCHRDYHSRNLMLHDGRLYVIDFQDARMGPDTYDLASLLRDSYVDLTDVALDELIAYFLALKNDRLRGRFQAALRSDGTPAESEGARHVRLPDGGSAQSRVHPIHSADAEVHPDQSRQISAIRAPPRTAGRACRGASLANDEFGHSIIGSSVIRAPMTR